MKKLRMMIIIKDIEKFFKDLEDISFKDISDLKSKEKFYALSMLMFTIVNRAIYLGEEIISYKSLGFPEKYRDIFMLLEKGKVIDHEMAGALSGLIYYRNLAAHEYHEFTNDDLMEFYKKIFVVKGFVDCVKGL